ANIIQLMQSILNIKGRWSSLVFQERIPFTLDKEEISILAWVFDCWLKYHHPSNGSKPNSINISGCPKVIFLK
ncbi:MAG TPA: hypothetical protein VKI61_17870, partial [Chitinophagaceae bacterium]|nr:hypothetical protein [Chitinophagaceae bacterium]